MNEKELTDKITEFFTEIELGNYVPDQCRKLLKNYSNLWKEYKEMKMPVDNELQLLFRTYILTNKKRVLLENGVESIMKSPEYRSILFHSPDLNNPNVAKEIEKYTDIITKTHKKLSKIEKKVANLLGLSYEQDR